jgi:hypothetical protein
MPRTQASLPEPSRIGFLVLLLVICVLILINSILTTAIFHAVSANGPRWVREPRLSQPLLFLAPLMLLCLELWIGSVLGRLRRRPGGQR